MEDFVYHNPTKILFGKKKLELIGKETAVFGQKVLFVTGSQSLKASGYYQTILDLLKEACGEVYTLEGVVGNPTLSAVEAGIEICKKNDIEVICAAGGGSVIDTAKAISAGSLVNHKVWTFFRGKKPIRAALPVTCINTLAGSGSDMNSGMVITNEETRQKIGIANKHLFPKVSILNPELTLSVSANQTVWGTVDILSHLFEIYFSHQSNNSIVQDRLLEGLFLATVESCNNILKKNENQYGNRANLLWTASLALSGIPNGGLGKLSFIMHLLEHSISALHDVPHGKGLAAIIPGWLTLQKETNAARYDQFQQRIIANIPENSFSPVPDEFFKQWLHDVNCPSSLSDLGITANQCDALVENCLPVAKLWRMRDLSAADIKKYYLACL